MHLLLLLAGLYLLSRYSAPRAVPQPTGDRLYRAGQELVVFEQPVDMEANRATAGVAPGTPLLEAARRLQAAQRNIPVEHMTAFFDDAERAQIAQWRDQGLLPESIPLSDPRSGYVRD